MLLKIKLKGFTPVVSCDPICSVEFCIHSVTACGAYFQQSLASFRIKNPYNQTGISKLPLKLT